MTKLRRSLKNSARIVLNNIALSLAFLFLSISGCSSTSPTFNRDNICQAIQDISQKEYGISATAKLAGDTLWVYVPLKDLFTQAERPEKYVEKFVIDENEVDINERILKSRYAIKSIPEREKYQETKYNEKEIEKVSDIWKVLRRVIFSFNRKDSAEPKFYSIVAADTKNGIILQHIFYYLDLKKVSYGFIPWIEFQQRDVYNIIYPAPGVVGDEEGKSINFRDIALGEFIAAQITQRIKLKFQEQGIAPGIDIDKEIRKTISLTIKIYDFNDFDQVEIYNKFKDNLVTLSRAAIWEATSN